MKPQRNVEEQQKQAALSMLKRLPPQHLDENLTNFARVAPHLEQTLPFHVGRPLRIDRDPEQNRYFIVCDYNCDASGTRHRSPWSNKYFPPPPSADEDDKLFRPPGRLQKLEEVFNEVFDAYKTSYYDGGVSSVYLWDLDEGFAGAFLIHKEHSKDIKAEHGIWDSVHIVEVREPQNTHWVDYKVSTSVLLHTKIGSSTKQAGSEETELGGYITRTSEDRKKRAGEDSHLLHIGRMIEDVELSIRQGLDMITMAKQREVLNSIRLLEEVQPLSLPSPLKKSEAPSPRKSEASSPRKSEAVPRKSEAVKRSSGGAAG
jgi:capping protein beta